MEHRGASALSLPDDWPAPADPILALNRLGSFDWDLNRNLLYLDPQAHEVFDVRPDEFDGLPGSLGPRMPTAEASRLDSVVAQALKRGARYYGCYFRIRRRDGTLRWTHTQGYIHRDAQGRPDRILGVVRDATQELGETTTHRERPGEPTGIVQHATAALAHAHTVQDVIDVLGDTGALRRFGAAGLIMGLVEAGRLRIVTEDPPGGMVPGTRVTRIDDPYPMAEAVRTLKPVFIESADEFATAYPGLWPHISHLGIGSAACLPLIARARPIGALGLTYGGAKRFSQEDRDTLIALSGSIAQSLKRAMFYEQEREVAGGLQEAMLPRTIPAVPGADIAVRYRSPSLGRDIGGDWYDVIPLPGGRVGAVIGDVQGHDTHAAAVMGQLRIVLRAYAAEGHTPATVMARASVFLHELDTDRFATCLYAEADLSTGVVQVVRAGHLEPLLRLADGTCRALPVPGGLPLGLSAEFHGLAYPVAVVELDPGQSLVLCTDGLVERPGADLDDGMRALMDLIATGPRDLEELADLLCDSVDELRGGDDMALLLLRRRGAEITQAGGRLQHRVPQADPETLSEARHMVRAAVGAWGGREYADEIELVACELITNALTHTESGATLTLRLLTGDERRLRVEVEDASSVLPRRRDPADFGVSGRGLLLVNRLAGDWGVEARGSGKCVWAEFRTPPGGGKGG